MLPSFESDQLLSLLSEPALHLPTWGTEREVRRALRIRSQSRLSLGRSALAPVLIAIVICSRECPVTAIRAATSASNRDGSASRDGCSRTIASTLQPLAFPNRQLCIPLPPSPLPFRLLSFSHDPSQPHECPNPLALAERLPAGNARRRTGPTGG